MSKLAERLRGRAHSAKLSEKNTEQFLTFHLADEEYGVDILRVQEIRGFEPVSAIPNAPAFLLGVINLRGQVLPIVDLRTRFAMSARAPDKTTVVIIVNLNQGGDGVTPPVAVGIKVDAVSDVLDIELGTIKPPPRLGGFVDVAFIKGIATNAHGITKLIEIESLFDRELLAAAT